MVCVSKRGYYESALGYINVDWFVYEVKKIETKMAFFLKNTKIYNIMQEEDKKDYKKIIC